MRIEPGPVQIVTVCKEERSFELDLEALARVLLAPEIQDKHVVVLSVTGAFRKGKSFLLDFMLRFMYRKDDATWLGEDDEPLTGFSWKGGSEPETTGIQLWSEIFLVRKSDGREVAVLLMDTQGVLESAMTARDCSPVFAISTMISSMQIYNLSQNIQEDDVQQLQLFTEYGRLAMDESPVKPFQSLMFLIRDWSFPYEYSYGFKGGNEFLDKRLLIDDGQTDEVQSVREHIHSCYANISCFLLPHPGLTVATSSDYQGELRDLAPDFKEQLKSLIPKLLQPDNLAEKVVNGNKITCMGLLEFFKAYVKIYQGDDVPQPRTMYLATAEANNLFAVAMAKDEYCQNMEKVCGGDMPHLAPDTLEAKHQFSYQKALQAFSSIKQMGEPEFCDDYQEKLEKELEELWQSFFKHNESKNIFSILRTPAVLFVLLCILYGLSSMLLFVGLSTFAVACDCTLGLVFVAFLTWVLTRFSGLYQDVGRAIDQAVRAVLEQTTVALTMSNASSIDEEKKSN